MGLTKLLGLLKATLLPKLKEVYLAYLEDDKYSALHKLKVTASLVALGAILGVLWGYMMYWASQLMVVLL